MTDRRVSRHKASAAFLGAVHGAELPIPTLLTEFAEQLAEGYGRDPQATMLLRDREIHLIPMVNPDGVERMEEPLSGSDGGDLGRVNANHVDLNRNFLFGWGGNDSSSDPLSHNYRGPAPASEPETRAVVDYMEKLRPDLFVDWHSAAQVVLHPWGETTRSGSTSRGLRDLAQHVSRINGYAPMVSTKLYPTSGSAMDWVHGTLGGAALAVETGDQDFLTDPGYEAIRRENMPVLWGLAALADHPKARARGPVTFEATRQGSQISAGAIEEWSGGQTIAGAELVLDPAARPGTGIPLESTDSAFDSSAEWIVGTVPKSVSSNSDLGYIRARDVRGNWGSLNAFWLRDPQPPAPVSSPG